MAKKQSEGIDPEVRADPRVKDPVIANRIRFLASQEFVHKAWGCALWAFERLGYISQEQRMAGDQYQRLCYRFNTAHKIDPDAHILDDKETITDSIEKTKDKHQRAQELLGAGRDGIFIRRVTDALCLREEWPCTEKDKQRAKIGLGRLETILVNGTKRVRK
jgi:hypothetical protein